MLLTIPPHKRKSPKPDRLLARRSGKKIEQHSVISLPVLKERCMSAAVESNQFRIRQEVGRESCDFRGHHAIVGTCDHQRRTVQARQNVALIEFRQSAEGGIPAGLACSAICQHRCFTAAPTSAAKTPSK